MTEYPHPSDLKAIRTWSFKNKSVIELLEFIKSLWHWGEPYYFTKGKRTIYLELHTGGWSGNEEIIRALQCTVFWTLFWKASKVGGHYYFKIPRNLTFEKK